MRCSTLLTAILAFTSVWTVTAHAQFLMLDDFSSRSASLSDDDSTSDGDADFGPASVFGGNRAFVLSALGGPASASIDASLGQLAMAATPPAAFSVRVGYGSEPSLSANGLITSMASSLDADITAFNAFRIRTLGGIGQISMLLTTFDGASGVAVATSPLTLVGSAPQDLFVPFTDFTGGPLEFDNIDSIEVQFSSFGSSDPLIIDDIALVPEPTSAALLLIALPLLRRRRAD